jgi:hypothetical protein
MMQQRNPDAVPLRPAIPRLRTRRIRLHEFADRPRGRLRVLRRHRIVHHHVAVLIPEREVVRTQHRLGERIGRLARNTRFRQCPVQPVGPRRLDRSPVSLQNPGFELSKRWPRVQQIIERFAQADPQPAKQSIIRNPVPAVREIRGLPRPEFLQIRNADPAHFFGLHHSVRLPFSQGPARKPNPEIHRVPG